MLKTQSDFNAEAADVSSVPVEVITLRHRTHSVLYCLLYLSTQHTVQYRRVLSGDEMVILLPRHSNLIVKSYGWWLGGRGPCDFRVGIGTSD